MTKEKVKSPLAVRFFKGLGIAFLLLFSLLILAWVHENWSGAREWQRVEERLIAASVEMDPQKLIPEVPAEEENFGAHPLLAALREYETDEQGEVIYDDPGTVDRVKGLAFPDEVDRGGVVANWLNRKGPDYKALADQLELSGSPRAQVTEWLGQKNEIFAKMDKGANRPRAVYPFTLGETFMEQVSFPVPYLTDFMSLSACYSLRATAALDAGNEEEARIALNTLMQIGELASSQPLLISHLVGNACRENELSVIWYGIRRNLWSAESLSWIYSRLEGESDAVLKNLERALNAELVLFLIGGMDYLKTLNSGGASSEAVAFFGEDTVGRRLGLSLFPNGVFDHNKAFAAEWLFETGLEPLMKGKIGDGKREMELAEELHIGSFPAPRRFVAGIMVPAVSGAAKRSFSVAVATDMARLSCALELYRAKNGDYPESLSALVPDELDSIPQDRFSPTDGDILYRQEGDRYVLYSVGANGADNGGKAGFRSGSSEKVDWKKGDLVWGFLDLEDLPEGG